MEKSIQRKRIRFHLNIAAPFGVTLPQPIYAHLMAEAGDTGNNRRAVITTALSEYFSLNSPEIKPPESAA